MTEVVIIRHGETEWNREARYQGHNDSPLTTRGIQQAELTSERLADTHFDLLVSSDLGRAMDTANIIARPHSGLRWERDPRLRERHFGMLAGFTRSEAMEKFPEEENGYLTGGPHFRIPEGESLNDVYERCALCLNEWANRVGQGRLLIITHGGVLGQFLRYVLGVPLEAKRAYKFVNCAYNSFTFERNSWLLNTWGDESHLAAIGADDDI